MRAHRWRKFRRLAWEICECCGLIKLRNAATQRAVSLACKAKDEDR